MVDGNSMHAEHCNTTTISVSVTATAHGVSWYYNAVGSVLYSFIQECFNHYDDGRFFGLAQVGQFSDVCSLATDVNLDYTQFFIL